MGTTTKLLVSPAGRAFIKRWESFAANVYICPAGKPTVGYGHVVTTADRSARRFEKPITEAQADALLAEDLAPVELFLGALYPFGKLMQHELDAFASFCMNLGMGAFENSTLRKLYDSGQKRAAADQFGRWVYANDPKTGGKFKLNGLVNRRAAERDMFLGKPVESV